MLKQHQRELTKSGLLVIIELPSPDAPPFPHTMSLTIGAVPGVRKYESGLLQMTLMSTSLGRWLPSIHTANLTTSPSTTRTTPPRAEVMLKLYELLAAFDFSAVFSAH